MEIPAPPPPASTSGSTRGRNRRGLYLPARGGRRLLFISLYLVFCWIVLLVATRVYWYLAAAVPFNRKPSIWDQYYPRIRGVGLTEQRVQRTDDRFDVLLLGGSVLEPMWGTVEEELKERLERLIPGRVRIYNLAQHGFTSRDSLVQYEHLEPHRFDLVVVYDGINDVRMNCCPPELFRDDYSHCQRYRSFYQQQESATTFLPAFALDQARLALDSLLLGTTDPKLLDYAAEPQTPRAVRGNLERIAELADSRGDPLLLLSYAWHIPAEYTLEKFAAGELDYSQEFKSRCAVELWGRPQHVAHAMDLQNREIRELVESNPRIRFVDMHEDLHADGENFVDPCHLAPKGCVRFVEALWLEMERAVRESPAGQAGKRDQR